jgi:hypothetical protein
MACRRKPPKQLGISGSSTPSARPRRAATGAPNFTVQSAVSPESMFGSTGVMLERPEV